MAQRNRTNKKRRNATQRGGDIYRRTARARQRLEDIQREISTIISELSVDERAFIPEPGQPNNHNARVRREIERVSRVRAAEAAARR